MHIRLNAIFGVKYEWLSCNMAHFDKSFVSKLHVDHAQHVQSVHPRNSVFEIQSMKEHDEKNVDKPVTGCW